MPKMKSVKGAVKRFRVKKSGKIKRGTAYRSHILTKKSTKRMRGLKESQYISKADEGLIKILLVNLSHHFFIRQQQTSLIRVV